MGSSVASEGLFGFNRRMVTKVFQIAGFDGDVKD